MQTQISECIGDATVIAVGLAQAKRRPPADVEAALRRLVQRLRGMVIAPAEVAAVPVRTLEYPPPSPPMDDWKTRRCSECGKGPDNVAGSPPRCLECLTAQMRRTVPANEPAPAPEPEPKLTPGDRALDAVYEAQQAKLVARMEEKLAAIQAEIAARTSRPAAPRAPAAAPPRAAVRPVVQVAKPEKLRVPPLPSIPEVVVMLQRVIRLKEGAVRRKGKVDVTVDFSDLASEWLKGERQTRATLRRMGRWQELAERTPAFLTAQQPGQDPEKIGDAWELEEAWLEADSAHVVGKYDRSCICGREEGQKHTNRCWKKQA